MRPTRGRTLRETAHDSVTERVDAQGQVIGFSILGVSQFKKDRPLEAAEPDNGLRTPSVLDEKNSLRMQKRLADVELNRKLTLR